MLGTMTLFKIIIIIKILIIMTMLTITVIIMISTKIFQNITEKLEKVTYFVFTIFGVLLPLKVLCHPLVRKDVIKVQ